MNGTLVDNLVSLREICVKFSDGLNSDSKDQNNVQRIDKPLNALADIAKLIKAHTTKIGICFKPPISEQAAIQCVNDLGKLLANPVAVYMGMSENIDGKLVVRETYNCVRNLYLAVSMYSERLQQAFEDEQKRIDKPSTNVVSPDNSLVMVGEVWQSCDQMSCLQETGSSGILSTKLVQYGEIISDGLEDLQSWIEEGKEEDDDDGGNASDNDDNVDDKNNNDDIDDIFGHSVSVKDRDPKLVQISSKWVDRLKKLEFLYKAIKRQRSSKLTPPQHDKIYDIIFRLSADIDDTVAAFLENNIVELNSTEPKVDQQVNQLIDLVRPSEHEQDDKFNQFINLFSNSFFK